jgi:uncharacterized repeat protein (TIGR03943 family)
VVLLLAGGALMKIALLGSYVRYVKVGQRWYLVAAGAVLPAVALINLAHAWKTAGRQLSRGHHGSEHQHPGFDPSWLLVVPALALLLIAPPALGSHAAARGGTALAAGARSDFPPLPDGDPVRTSLLDYASRAINDHGRSLEHRQITLAGFLMSSEDGARYLARMVIICCAADARPIKVGRRLQHTNRYATAVTCGFLLSLARERAQRHHEPPDVVIQISLPSRHRIGGRPPVGTPNGASESKSVSTPRWAPSRRLESCLRSRPAPSIFICPGRRHNRLRRLGARLDLHLPSG